MTCYSDNLFLLLQFKSKLLPPPIAASDPIDADGFMQGSHNQQEATVSTTTASATSSSASPPKSTSTSSFVNISKMDEFMEMQNRLMRQISDPTRMG